MQPQFSRAPPTLPAKTRTFSLSSTSTLSQNDKFVKNTHNDCQIPYLILLFQFCFH